MKKYKKGDRVVFCKEYYPMVGGKVDGTVRTVKFGSILLFDMWFVTLEGFIPPVPISKIAPVQINEELQCEGCEGFAPENFMRITNNGNYCPNCVQDQYEDELRMYKQLLVELADPSLSRDDVKGVIKHKYCKLYGINEDEYEIMVGEG